MPIYQIADLTLDFRQDFNERLTEYEPYAADFKGQPDAVVCFKGCSKIHAPQGELLINEYTKWYQGERGVKSYVACLPDPGDRNDILCSYDIDNWNNVIVKYIKGVKGIENYVASGLGQILIRNLVALHQGVLLHSSAILWNGMGIAFTAPSGTGKSTHTALWENHFDARVINDDSPAIRLINGEPIIYGTPWSGSHCKHLNLKAPLAYIFIIEQAQQNDIRKLNLSEATARLLPRFLLPYYDEALMHNALSVCDKIITSTPVCLLKCRPDQDAAELVRQYIK